MLVESIKPNYALMVHRFEFYVNNEGWIGKIPFLRVLLKGVANVGRFSSIIISKILIHRDAVFGKNIWLSPKGNIILGVKQIGNNCRIHHDVTVGSKLGAGTFDKEKGVVINKKPSVGDNVWIGSGSCVTGDIRIGSGVTILEGSILTKSIPDKCIVGGNPAKIVRKNFDNVRFLVTDRSEISQVNL